MNSLESLRARRDDILRIAIRHGAHNVRVFGSVARGEATEDSDVDFLVSTSESPSPWGFNSASWSYATSLSSRARATACVRLLTPSLP